MIPNNLHALSLPLAFNPSRQPKTQTDPVLSAKPISDSFQLTFSGQNARKQFAEALALGKEVSIAKFIGQFNAQELSKILTDDDTHTTKLIGETPLHYLAGKGSASLVQLILDKGVDPDLADKSGITPLRGAAISGNADTVTNLLNTGATVDHQGRDGKTALGFAVYYARPETTQVLLNAYQAKGLDPAKEMEEPGKTLLHRMVDTPGKRRSAEDVERTARALVKAGLDINQQGIYGSTPLTLAIATDHLTHYFGEHPVNVQGLLQAGADPQAPDAKGQTPLQAAEGAPELIKLLKSFGAKDQPAEPAKAQNPKRQTIQSVTNNTVDEPDEPTDGWDVIDRNDAPPASSLTFRKRKWGNH